MPPSPCFHCLPGNLKLVGLPWGVGKSQEDEEKGRRRWCSPFPSPASCSTLASLANSPSGTQPGFPTQSWWYPTSCCLPRSFDFCPLFIKSLSYTHYLVPGMTRAQCKCWLPRKKSFCVSEGDRVALLSLLSIMALLSSGFSWCCLSVHWHSRPPAILLPTGLPLCLYTCRAPLSSLPLKSY